MKTPTLVSNKTTAVWTSRPACQLILSMAALAGFALHAQASTFEVGGVGTIGDSTLAPAYGFAQVPNSGAMWAAAGGENGNAYTNLKSRTFTVPANGAVTLKFNHRYNFESEYDGGAVYISVNGAAPTQVTDFSENGYNYTAGLLGGGVFTGGEPVFNGPSSGWDTSTYIQSTANLGTFTTGQTISVQFRGGWDGGTLNTAPGWEISSVQVTDSASTDLLNVTFTEGAGAFTVTSDTVLAGPWTYPGTETCRFELDATTDTADRFKSSTPGPINFNNARLEVVLLTGTLVAGDTFSLFDLSDGSTLEGAYSNLVLPTGSWDVSGLKAGGNGQITFLDSSTWVQTAANTYSWDDNANWSNGFPNSVGKIANLKVDITGEQTINLNQSITVTGIDIGDTSNTGFGKTIAAGGGSLILDAGSATATIARAGGNNNSGTDTISANIQLNSNLALSDVNGSFGWTGDGNSSSLTLSGNISGVGKGLIVNGPGVVRLKGTNDFSGGVTLNSGRLVVSSQALGTGTLTINGGWINGINGEETMTQNNPMIWNNDFYVGWMGFNMGTGAITLTKPITLSVTHGLTIGGTITGPDGLNAFDIKHVTPPGTGSSIIFKTDVLLRAGQSVAVGDPINGGTQCDGVISDGGAGYGFTKTGSGGLTLTAVNTYTGDTVVSAGTLTLNNGGSTKFKVTNSASNKITGTGTAALNGTFDIDTSAVTATAGSWTLVDVATKTYGSTFSITGYTLSGGLWSKTDGTKTWVFNPSTGVLALPAAWITSFTYGTAVGLIDQAARTISLTVPYGTNPATVNPTFELYSGTCDRTSGAVPSPKNFLQENPLIYTVTDSGAGITREYTVTLTVSPPAPAGVGVGLALWLDASDATTMTISGTDTVTEWRDKFGGTGKMTLWNGAPTLVASGINTIPTVSFNTSARMSDGVNRQAGPVTILYVSRQTGGANSRVLQARDNNWLMGYWGAQRSSFYFNGDVRLGSGIASDTAPHLYAATIGGSGVNSTVYAEGDLVASNQGGTEGPNNLALNGGEASDCEISEVLVYDRILTTDELNAVGAYLSVKYGLTTSYPGPAEIVSFGIAGYDGVINKAAKTILLSVPIGTDFATLAPNFTLTSGACDRTSGAVPTPKNFAQENPLTYTVTDGETINAYIVTVQEYVPPYTWVKATDPGTYDWESAHWDHPGYPNAAATAVTCNSQAGDNIWNITSSTITIGSLHLGGDVGARHTLNGAGKTLVFDNGASNASLSRGTDVNTTTGAAINVGTIMLNSTLDVNITSHLTSALTISSAIGGPGGLNVIRSDGDYQWAGLTLSGANTYTGDTVISTPAQVTLKDTTGSLTFKVTDSGSNKISGAGTIYLNGSFVIDTSAVSAVARTWTLVDVGTLSEYYGGSFSVAGEGWAEVDNVWTKAETGKAWTFTEATGVLELTLTIAPADIAVAQGATEIASAGTFDFGDVLVGVDKTVTFTVNNPGGMDLADLVVTAPTGTNAADFTVTQVLATPVAGGASTTFTVKIIPSALGVRSAAITITSNVAAKSPYTINLTGTGTGAFANWAYQNITTHNSGADASATGDPDGDGSNNLSEYAFGGDPMSGSDNGKVFSQFKVRDIAGNGKELILTVAVLTDTSATFVADGNALIGTSPAGGITYRIEGSNDLNFSNVQVGQVIPEPTTAMGEAPAGYTYRSFVLAPGGTPAKGFLRAVVVKP